MTREKLFPVQLHNGKSAMTWAEAEIVYEMYSAVYPGSASMQSLERMAERGGFGTGEIVWLAAEFIKRFPGRQLKTAEAALSTTPAK